MYADCFPRARVTVSVAGETAVEYETENEPLKVKSFIEAIPGANFAVILDIEQHFAYRDPQDSLRFKVSLDGRKARANLIGTHHHNVIQAKIEGIRILTEDDVTMLRRLQFAEHGSTEDSVGKSALEKLSSVGEIKVELFKCRKNSKLPRTSSQFEAMNEDAIPEKAFKGRSISSHTRLGPAEVVASSRQWSITYPHGKVPIATYVFQYRTRRDLQIEGIIERTPSPIPLEERDPNELTPDELREQNRLLREKRPSVKIKEEIKSEKRTRQHSATLSNEDDGEGDVTFVSEANKRRRKRESMEGEELIDLSNDD
ncbi:hypothetical protein Q7P35_010860 [Cladosporium inversicolor]